MGRSVTIGNVLNLPMLETRKAGNENAKFEVCCTET